MKKTHSLKRNATTQSYSANVKQTKIVVDMNVKSNTQPVIDTTLNSSLTNTLKNQFIVRLKLKPSNLEKIQNEFQNNLKILNKKTVHHSNDNVQHLLFIETDNTNVEDFHKHVPVSYFDELDEYPLFKDINKVYKNNTKFILPLFNTESKEWPKSSNYSCWNCDCFFSGPPIGIPVDESFKCHGNFCSFACSARYIKDRESNSDFFNKYSLLSLLYQRCHVSDKQSSVYNVLSDNVLKSGPSIINQKNLSDTQLLDVNMLCPIAPPVEALLRKGGTLTDEQYHSISESNDKIIEIYQLPIVPTLLRIAEISKSTNVNNISNIKSYLHDLTENLHISGDKKLIHIPIDPSRLKKAQDNIKKLRTQLK